MAELTYEGAIATAGKTVWVCAYYFRNVSKNISPKNIQPTECECVDLYGINVLSRKVGEKLDTHYAHRIINSTHTHYFETETECCEYFVLLCNDTISAIDQHISQSVIDLEIKKMRISDLIEMYGPKN